MKWILCLPLLLIGFAAEAQLNANPGFVDFGDVTINQGGRRTTVWINNISNQPTTVTVNNSCYGSFYSSNNCYSLPAHGSCTMQIEFAPRRVGPDSCYVNVNSFNGGFATVNVRGRGVENQFFEITESAK